MAYDADFQADVELKRAQLLEQLAGAPIVEILGAVGPRGAGGWKSKGEDQWTLSFTFDRWRIVGANLQTKPLAMQRAGTEEELKHFMGLIGPYAVIRIKARIIINSPFGRPDGLLEEFIGSDDSDAELNHYVEELQKPVTFDDPTLGAFTLNREVGWFSGQIIWNGNTATINLSGETIAEAQESAKVACVLMESQALWEQRVRDYAVQELLSVKNDGWIDEDEADLTPDDFKNKMTLESIVVDADGGFEFWYDDGDLFWGHAINVRGNLSDGPKYADFSG